MMQQLSVALARKEHVLLYPQGELAKQGYQSIIGKKSAFYAVQHAPKGTKYIMVTIRGLRGSRSSMAWDGKPLSFTRFLCKGLYFFLLNLFFLTPKRKVSIQLSDASENLQKAQDKGLDYFNVQLEKVYNAQGEEQIQYLSGLWFYNTVLHHHVPTKIEGSLDMLRKKVDYSTLKYPKDTFTFIVEKVKTLKPDFKGEISLETNLVLDLYFDSLDMAELKSSVATAFPGASNPPLLDLKAVGDVLLMAMGKSPYVEELKPCVWVYQENKSLIYNFLKKEITNDATLLSVLQKSFKKLHNQSVCYDQLFGVQSAKDFLIKAYLIADILRGFAGKNIAIMLPSLSATSLLIIACYLAEKIPVMLNRTQSEKAFAHCVKSQEVSVILTAGSFFKKIQTPWLQNYEMTFFEELLKKVSLGQKIKALVKALRYLSCPSRLCRIPSRRGNHLGGDATAVILFTSGSEALPKAVALTHQHILQDLKGATELLDIRQDEVLLAFLPPFHSFGFTVNTMLPLISGIRVVYAPDPNDASMLVHLIPHTGVTLLTSTPTFLKGIFTIARNDQLSSLRFAVVGAEKPPQELFHLFQTKAPQATLLEGYGITECSPVIAVSPFRRPAKSSPRSAGYPSLQ
jgi:long-chain-fatty-acid--[acyl-carrier-protein] ligase